MAGKIKGKTRVETLNVKELKGIAKNARFMDKITFDKLKRNIEYDGEMTSLPLVVKRKDFYEIVSGNHRVRAVSELGHETVKAVVIDEEDVSEDDIRRIQLSHNAITGEDDKTILAEIYRSIDDLEMRELSGLDDSVFTESYDNLFSIAPKGLKTGIVNLLFLEGELDEFVQNIDYLQEVCKGDATFLARYQDYDEFLQNMGELKHKLNIKNHSALILHIINERAQQEREKDGEVQEG
ncbi:ParB/RepB/Spo0J family partition protein [Candidatus Magnetobacterium casense]|uniref:ParB N-terminal domain-containing protein n=1 Tax=Candidatus Magnetobacterium casense TaxID=1455061 RepID=A0ABS6S2L7_9BACT|nr:ParB/RepB/Spo0J family partition protein [Candidatus Magnetobacterium casensis]MBV6343081.1 ParB N-terminal domain-containing protein [Candidatus Magnetobacterium casensis]